MQTRSARQGLEPSPLRQELARFLTQYPDLPVFFVFFLFFFLKTNFVQGTSTCKPAVRATQLASFSSQERVCPSINQKAQNLDASLSAGARHLTYQLLGSPC